MIRKGTLCSRQSQPIHYHPTHGAAAPATEGMPRIQIRIAAVVIFAAALIAASTLHPETTGTAARTNVAAGSICPMTSMQASRELRKLTNK